MNTKPMLVDKGFDSTTGKKSQSVNDSNRRRWEPDEGDKASFLHLIGWRRVQVEGGGTVMQMSCYYSC